MSEPFLKNLPAQKLSLPSQLGVTSIGCSEEYSSYFIGLSKLTSPWGFAAPPIHVCQDMEKAEHWLFERKTLCFAHHKFNHIGQPLTQFEYKVNKMVDLYTSVFELAWPAEWKNKVC